MREGRSESERDRAKIPELILFVIREEIEDTFVTIAATIDSLSIDSPSCNGAAQIICVDLRHNFETILTIQLHDVLKVCDRQTE
jgi:hypothetical protein